MASLRLLTRSFLRPTAVLHNINRRSPHHLQLLNIHITQTQTRPYYSSPKFAFDESFLRRQTDTMADIPSIFFHMVTGNMPGLESDEALYVSFNMPGVKEEDVQAILTHEYLLISCILHGQRQVYKGAIKLPPNFDRNGVLNFQPGDGTAKLTLPLVKCTSSIVTHNVMDTFIDHTTRGATFYCALMDRSYKKWEIDEALADVGVKCNSFTLHKKETLESISVKGSMPGLVKLEATSEGLRVSLNMAGLQIDDVKCSFAGCDRLMIEGKRKKEHCIEHYIASIRMPEGFHGKDYMAKNEMEDGMFKVRLRRVGC